MSRNEPSQGFAERLRRLRYRLGFTKVSDFAREAGLQAQSVRNWESRGATPSLNTITKAIRALGLGDWAKIAVWLVDPECEAPSWLSTDGPVPRDGGQFTPAAGIRMPGLGQPKRALPWLTLEMLAQRAREAAGRQDLSTLEIIEKEFLDVVCPHCRAGKGEEPWPSSSASSPPPRDSLPGSPSSPPQDSPSS